MKSAKRKVFMELSWCSFTTTKLKWYFSDFISSMTPTFRCFHWRMFSAKSCPARLQFEEDGQQKLVLLDIFIWYIKFYLIYSIPCHLVWKELVMCMVMCYIMYFYYIMWYFHHINIFAIFERFFEMWVFPAPNSIDVLHISRGCHDVKWLRTSKG